MWFRGPTHSLRGPIRKRLAKGVKRGDQRIKRGRTQRGIKRNKI